MSNVNFEVLKKEYDCTILVANNDVEDGVRYRFDFPGWSYAHTVSNQDIVEAQNSDIIEYSLSMLALNEYKKYKSEMTDDEFRDTMYIDNYIVTYDKADNDDIGVVCIGQVIDGSVVINKVLYGYEADKLYAELQENGFGTSVPKKDVQ